MSTSHRYKKRDHTFGLLLVTLREKASLTQANVTSQTGISEKTLRNWESGNNYPEEKHLKTLIEFYLGEGSFVPEKEHDEAHALWKHMTNNASRRKAAFDETWFAVLLTAYHQQGHHFDKQPDNKQQAFSSVLPIRYYEDWKESLDVSAFYGREQELTELEHWVLTDRCRLITVLGMGGIGKTTLSVKFMHQIAPHFQHVLWRSLKDAPLLDDLLIDYLVLLSEQHVEIPPHLEGRITLLLEVLRARRCLLVLDNMETVLQAGLSDGSYCEGYEEYGFFITRLAQTTHQSCVLLSSREKPKEVGLLEGSRSFVRTLLVKGLQQRECQDLLQEKALFGNPKSWNNFIRIYTGNPLALKFVAVMVQDLFGGDIGSFLQDGTILFRSIHHLLNQHYERLSALEQDLLSCLAMKRDVVSADELYNDFVHEVPKREILEALHSLYRRSLLERGKNSGLFTLTPILSEYVIERLVEQISTKSSSENSLYVSNDTLLQKAKEYIHNSQRYIILQPSLEPTINALPTQAHS